MEQFEVLLIDAVVAQTGGGGAGGSGAAPAARAGEAGVGAGGAAADGAPAAGGAGGAAAGPGGAAGGGGTPGAAGTPGATGSGGAGGATGAAAPAPAAEPAAQPATSDGAQADGAGGTTATTEVEEPTLGAAQEQAPPWVEYAFIGVVVAVFLWLLISGSKKRAQPPPRRTTPRPAEETEERKSSDEIRREAQEAFRIPQVLAGGTSEVRMADASEAPPPTGAKAEPPPEPEPEPAATASGASPGVQAPVATPEPSAPEPTGPRVEAAGKTLREGLARTHEGFVKKLGKIFGGAKTIDDDLLGELEEALFTADIGVRTSHKLMEMVYEALGKKDLKDPHKVWQALQDKVSEMLRIESKAVDFKSADPFVLMVVGVNGAGKTTTIGKLSAKLKADGHKVLLAAGDTFRAAAVEQLEEWGRRTGTPVVRGKEKQDPSSVIFEACERARREGFDVVIADTAGRLQAKKELMDELKKVHRVIGKAVDGGPHEVWLVLDATNGQNAISQAKEFTSTVDVTGLVLTKLDGTAKGGVVIGICDEMRLPVRYIGIGEKVEDLRVFEPEAFADALFHDGG